MSTFHKRSLAPFVASVVATAFPLHAQPVSPAPEVSEETSALPTGGTPDPVIPEEPVPQTAASTNVTVNLISRLVQKGILTQEEAALLIQQAENDAAQAQACAQRIAATLQ